MEMLGDMAKNPANKLERFSRFFNIGIIQYKASDKYVIFVVISSGFWDKLLFCL